MSAVPPIGKKAIALANANIYASGRAERLAYSSVEAYTHSNPNANANVLADAYSFTQTDTLNYALALTNANIYVLNELYDIALDSFINYTKWSLKFQIYEEVNYSQIIATLEELKQQISNYKKRKEVHRKEVHYYFRNKIFQIWLEAFKLAPEIIHLSDLEKQALNNYLYANLLMVECKKAAVRVSKETWKEIESRMLLPAKNHN